jgi:predicted transcriptional regulator
MRMTAKQLKKWRQRRKWSQAQAAAWWGVTRRTWQRYEQEDGDGRIEVPEPLALRINDPYRDVTHIVGGKIPEVYA